MKLTGNKSERLGTEPILSLLFKLSIPSIIAMAIQALYNVVDSIYVGHLSKEALSALSLAYPIQLVLIAIAVGTGVGTSTYISRQLGKGNKEKAEKAAESILQITLIYGVIFALIGFLFSDKLIALFTDNSLLIQMGEEYIRIILIGSLALFIPMVGNNILRGEGNTFLPMITMLIGSVINIILDPFLIFGIWFFPKLGVGGAALATVISRLISGSFLLFILFSNKNELKINVRNINFDQNMLKPVYAVALPSMLMQLLASVMIAGINKWVLAPVSTTAIAVAGIYFRLQSFVFMPVFGLNQGYMPLVGYNYGHQNPQRMAKTIKLTFLTAFTFTTAGFLLFQIFPAQLIMMFNNDPQLVEMGTTALKRISLAFPIIGPSIIIASTFQALGRGLPSLILSITRQLVFLLPLMYIFSIYSNLDSVWYAIPIAETLGAAIGALWLTSYLKQTLKQIQRLN